MDAFDILIRQKRSEQAEMSHSTVLPSTQACNFDEAVIFVKSYHGASFRLEPRCLLEVGLLPSAKLLLQQLIRRSKRREKMVEGKIRIDAGARGVTMPLL
jgi:hypothetical protein